MNTDKVLICAELKDLLDKLNGDDVMTIKDRRLMENRVLRICDLLDSVEKDGK